MPEYENALTEKVIQIDPNISIYNDINEAEIVNGNIKAYITNRNRIVFKNSNDEILLEEYLRERAIANDMGNEDVNVQSITNTDGVIPISLYLCATSKTSSCV